MPLSGPDGFLDVVRELHPADYVPGEGYHILVGDSSDNYIDGSGATSISSMGYLGDDRIIGSSGNDYIYGNNGNDTFISNAGDDVLFGGSDRDIFYAGSGDDVLIGGSGSDRFYAGSGDDYINFGVDENGNGTIGRYYSEAGDDRLNMNNEWAWLQYDYEDTPDDITYCEHLDFCNHHGKCNVDLPLAAEQSIFLIYNVRNTILASPAAAERSKNCSN